MLLVALRLCIGWHFFYEGVWKVNNADSFSALPFLTLSKGPFAPIFYSMAPDLDGRIRLTAEAREATWFAIEKAKVDVVRPEGEKPALDKVLDFKEVTEKIVVYPAYYDQVKAIYDAALEKFKPEGEQLEAFRMMWSNYVTSSSAAVADSALDVQAYLNALDRLEADRADGNDGPEQKKRQWAAMMDLRREANGFLNVQQDLADKFCLQLAELTKEAPAEFVVGTDLLPFGLDLPFIGRSWTSFLDFAVTWALTLIGACLILGFCTRIAAVGGGIFLIMVLMTQPPWPPLFPAAHPETGHALIVDKNFVEMVAIFVLAFLPVGSWAGLDYFVWRWFGKPVCTKLGWVSEDA